jgi:hypothetical protein
MRHDPPQQLDQDITRADLIDALEGLTFRMNADRPLRCAVIELDECVRDYLVMILKRRSS